MTPRFIPTPCPVKLVPATGRFTWSSGEYQVQKKPQHRQEVSFWQTMRDIEADDTIYVTNRADTFTLAHEVGHATGHQSRLDRKSIYWYHVSLSAMRIEETIADKVALALCGLGRPPEMSTYPPVTPGTRAAYYVDVKAHEALHWLLSARSEP